jgi:V/A-type H+-transporting ATPase subunit I
MIINIYSALKRKRLESAIFGANGIAGLTFYLSIILGLILNIFSPFYIIFLIILPAICILFQEPLGHLLEKKADWQPKNWGEYCSQAFFEMFEVLLGYVSNTLSFLRVGAYVLIHAGMMMVVFEIAKMAAKLAGAAGYWPVIFFGNAFIIISEGLLVGIQVLRLEFYEIFSRFFQGQGYEFSPVIFNKLENKN